MSSKLVGLPTGATFDSSGTCSPSESRVVGDAAGGRGIYLAVSSSKNSPETMVVAGDHPDAAGLHRAAGVDVDWTPFPSEGGGARRRQLVKAWEGGAAACEERCRCG